MTARINFTGPGVTGILFASVRGDPGIDIGGRQGVKPRRLAPLQAFSSQSGGGAAVRMKSWHAHNDNCRLAAAVDDEALIILGGEVHDLAELSTRDMGVDAAIHLADLIHGLIN